MSYTKIVTSYYFLSAGAMLLLAPWTPVWSQGIAQLPGLSWLGFPLVRSLLSGFGAVLIFSAFVEFFNGFNNK